MSSRPCQTRWYNRHALIPNSTFVKLLFRVAYFIVKINNTLTAYCTHFSLIAVSDSPLYFRNFHQLRNDCTYIITRIYQWKKVARCRVQYWYCAVRELSQKHFVHFTRLPPVKYEITRISFLIVLLLLLLKSIVEVIIVVNAYYE